ncbi:MAG: DNA repair ATPase [Verrucomicrobiota bacterium]
MAEDAVIEDSTAKEKPEALQSGAYEIIRSRLMNHAEDLKERLNRLNQARKEVFGSIESTLLTTDRVTTKNNCVARDITPLNKNRFLFGYNVHLGLKTETELSDVFSVYEYKDSSFHELDLSIIFIGDFPLDFKQLYKYYKDTRFAKFRIIGPNLFMVFRVGKSINDIKTFKWNLQNDEIKYLGNRFDHEFSFPPQHEFEWIRTHRDHHQKGRHPHISIENRLFVETTGGDLTVKVENNTDVGEGIYSERVENPDQTLDDAEIFYASVGKIVLLKVKPFQEKNFRHLVFNEKLNQVLRIDKIESACVLLPDDHGIIFPDGYYLQSGEHKVFGTDLKDMIFSRRIESPNGEDFLYVFYNRLSGTYLLLQYNIIDQQVKTPIVCHGYSLFENGELVYFKSSSEPQKHHSLQVWKTPFLCANAATETKNDSFLYKIGNRELVRCMAECHEILNLINRDDSYADLYIDLVSKTATVTDAYFWLDKPEALEIKKPLVEIRQASESAIDEFDKVVRLKRHASDQLKISRAKAGKLAVACKASFTEITQFVELLTELRMLRGEVISLKELRYMNLERVNEMESALAEDTQKLSEDCVKFLLKPKALNTYRQQAEDHQNKVLDTSTVMEIKDLEDRIDHLGSGLEMLIDVVSNLKIEDSTETTKIIDNISTIYSSINQTRAELKKRKSELGSTEAKAQFGSQLKLIGQTVVNYLDLCDSSEKCDAYLTKLMIQLEELEGQFAEYDEFIPDISEKRDEIYNAFESKKLNLVEAKNRRAQALMSSAERIFNGIRNRVKNIETVNEINAYMAADLMVEKIRNIVQELHQLEDSVKADDIQGRLKTIKEDSVRQLKDRQELFIDGKNIIRLGKHSFSVNTQSLDLTIVRKENDMFFHLTGTNYFSKITDDRFLQTRQVWTQDVISENDDVYRAEYLAYLLLKQFQNSDEVTLQRSLGKNLDNLHSYLQEFMSTRYAEGYVKGVHDQDASTIFSNLLSIHKNLGLIRYAPSIRTAALLFWSLFEENQSKQNLKTKFASFGTMKELYQGNPLCDVYIEDLESKINDFLGQTKLFPTTYAPLAAEYLFLELSNGTSFSTSQSAVTLVNEFQTSLKSNQYAEKFQTACAEIQNNRSSLFELIRDWVGGFARELNDTKLIQHVDEASILILLDSQNKFKIVSTSATKSLGKLRGNHPSLNQKGYTLDYHEFIKRLSFFEKNITPQFESYQNAKKDLIREERRKLKLDEFKPRVLSSFVRNRLINDIYLPMVGDNLAKQLGNAGESKRTDLMGLLLVISPPGYGKTTLMEYIANRLGLVFMKISGPTLGHRVMSLDPEEAPNASAREELTKLNLAFEMGDNVMIYLDDIQHCNPELLQKFISLCDGQRRIEGVWAKQPKTYDLRGKKVAVVMAGNPYTESGEKFQIPDMLANRADTYNLGDILGGSENAFKLSYLENSITSNSVLNQLASRSQKDIYSIIRIAETGSKEGINFEGSFSMEEVDEMVNVMQKLIKLRDVILRVNLAYIHSASQSDAYRTEPPFKLQGSYRNMNRLAEKIAPIMNEKELDQLIIDHYVSEAQTLTAGAEANLLKFKELNKLLTDLELQRWNDIKSKFQTNLRFDKVDENDPVGKVAVQLSAFNEGLEEIKKVLARGLIPPKKEVVSEKQLSQESMATQATPVIQESPSPTPEESYATASPYQVEIVYSLPEAFNQLLQRQSQMMETLLYTVQQSTSLSIEQVAEMKNAIGHAMKEYQHVLKQMKYSPKQPPNEKSKGAKKAATKKIKR